MICTTSFLFLYVLLGIFLSAYCLSYNNRKIKNNKYYNRSERENHEWNVKALSVITFFVWPISLIILIILILSHFMTDYFEFKNSKVKTTEEND